MYEVGEFRLDLRRRKLLRADGAAVPLSGKSFDALVYLVQHAGRLVPRAELTKALWPTTVVEDNNLNVAISTLRRALGDEPPAQRYVVTVAGRGYQLVADVRAVDRDDGDEPVNVSSPPPAPAIGVPPPTLETARGVRTRSRWVVVAAVSLAAVVAVAVVVAITRGWRSATAASETAAIVDSGSAGLFGHILSG